MPFARPTLTQLRAQAAADLAAGLPGSDSLLRFSNLGLLGDVLAAMASGHYGYLDWIAKQSTPFTATDAFLDAWAALKGVTRKPATLASGSATFTGTNGTLVPSGTALTATTGDTFVTTADVTVAAGAAISLVSATVAGSAGNLALLAGLTTANAIPGLSTTGFVSTLFVGGAETETDDALRTRMLFAYAKPPQGGAGSDYIAWALAVPGVTRAWVAPNALGNGMVSVFVMLDISRSAFGGFPQGANGVAAVEGRGTPATGDQLAVANALFAVAPVTSLVTVVAPVPNTVNLTIAGMSTASASVKSAVTTAARAALANDGAFSGVTSLSIIEAAIAAVPGAAGFVITGVAASAGSVSPATVGNISSNAGALPVLGTVTFS